MFGFREKARRKREAFLLGEEVRLGKEFAVGTEVLIVPWIEAYPKDAEGTITELLPSMARVRSSGGRSNRLWPYSKLQKRR